MIAKGGKARLDSGLEMKFPMKIKRLRLSGILLWLAVLPARSQSTLEVEEHFVTGVSGGAVLLPAQLFPRGYFDVVNPALVSSKHTQRLRSSHEPCPGDEHDDFEHTYNYRYSSTNAINRSRQPGFGFIITPGQLVGFACSLNCLEEKRTHSAAQATGYVETGALRLGGFASVWSEGRCLSIQPPSREASAKTIAIARNRLLVLPGSSGLPNGTPVRLRYRFPLSVSLEAYEHPAAVGASASCSFQLDGQIQGQDLIDPGDGESVPAREVAAQFIANGSLSANKTPFGADTNQFPGSGFMATKFYWTAHSNLDPSSYPGGNSGGITATYGNDFFGERLDLVTGGVQFPTNFIDFRAKVGETPRHSGHAHFARG